MSSVQRRFHQPVALMAVSIRIRVYSEERRAEVANASRDRVTLERNLIDITGQLDRLMQALTRGILPIEVIETQYKFLEA